MSNDGKPPSVEQKTTAEGKKLMSFEELQRQYQNPEFVADLQKVSKETAESKRGFLEHGKAMDEIYAKHGFATYGETFEHVMGVAPMDPATRIVLLLIKNMIAYQVNGPKAAE
jgi:hypothetical protein